MRLRGVSRGESNRFSTAVETAAACVQTRICNGGGFTFSEVRALPMTILAGTSIYVLSFFFVGRSTKKRKLRAAFPFSPCSLTEHHINDVVLRCNRVPLWASAVSLPNTVALEWVESVFFLLLHCLFLFSSPLVFIVR